MRQVVIVIDVEPDPGLVSYRNLLDLESFLKGKRDFTLMVTPDIMSKFESKIWSWRKHHEVGLHVHPSLLGFPSDHLSHYSVQEKRRILMKSLRLLPDSIEGLRCFRAGRWSYSEDLPSILSSMDFDYDSSLFVNYECPNKSYKIDGVIEVPPTVHSLFPLKMLQRVGLLRRGGFVRTNGIESTAVKKKLTYHLTATLRRGNFFIFVFCESLLKNPFKEGVLYRLTDEVLDEADYLMFTFHSYDLCSQLLFQKVEKYITMLGSIGNISRLTDISCGV